MRNDTPAHKLPLLVPWVGFQPLPTLGATSSWTAGGASTCRVDQIERVTTLSDTMPRSVILCRSNRRDRVEERSTSMERDDPAYGGQSEYTPFFLKIYDPVVLGFFTRVVWRCPTTRLIEGYRRHVRPLHLDVGPGTGYFLERAGLPDGSPVTILDPNTNVLAHATRRLQRLDLTAVEADVCKPLPITGPFDSAALSGVIHCLPGPLSRKAGAIANVAAVLAPEGVLFGASILGTSGRHTRLARNLLDANNRRGVFDNLGDTEDGLREILAAAFERVELETVGSFAIFAATNPRSNSSAVTTPTEPRAREQGDA
jgi:SAM-dependent methyltransferase